MGGKWNIDFFSRVDKDGPDGCWLWTGPKNRYGYGIHSENHKSLKAHRWSYEYHKGPIPEGLQIDHLCRNRSCVNPDHLEAVTKKENTLRSQAPTALNARKTHCQNGHPFDAENTIINKHGWRYCRICTRERKRAKQIRRRERQRNEKTAS